MPKADLIKIYESYSQIRENIDPMNQEWSKAAKWYYKKYGQFPSKSVRFIKRGGLLGDTYEVVQNVNSEEQGDASAVNMGPDGIIEVQPNGQYPEPPKKDENAEEGGGPREGEDWRAHMTRNIVAKGAAFLRSLYELGNTGEAGDNDINEVVALLAQEAEGDERLKQAIEGVVVHMVNAGHADF